VVCFLNDSRLGVFSLEEGPQSDLSFFSSGNFSHGTLFETAEEAPISDHATITRTPNARNASFDTISVIQSEMGPAKACKLNGVEHD
jgi:hypothetical protein